MTELYNIMPIDNIPSVLNHGILSYERVKHINHTSLAMVKIQEKRRKVKIHGGLKLHQYSNLYFDARNPMMFKRKENSENLCILRVSIDVFTIEGTVISDQNASSDYARFLSPSEVNILDFDKIYAKDWRCQNETQYFRNKSLKCAEVLVPHKIAVKFILAAFVVNKSITDKLMRKQQFPVNYNIFI